MGGFVSVLVNLLVGLFKGWLGERSRDKAHQVSGELATENEILQAGAERAADARETANSISNLSDDELDRRLLDAGGSGKPAKGTD